MDQILTWLNDPIPKTVLLFVGGLILKRWPAFVNKAIPTTLIVVSAVLAIIKALFPSLVPDAAAAAAAVDVVVQHAPWWKTAIEAIAPAVIAVGLHSHSKNTREWIGTGLKVFQAVR